MPDAPATAEQKPTQEPQPSAERAHHPDSPSSLQSSEACPLFVNEQRESQASVAGVLQHKAAETRDTSILDTDEQVKAVQHYIDYVDGVGAAKYADAGEVLVYREPYVYVGNEKVDGFDGVTGGYLDEAIVADVFADIFDAKFGAIPVAVTKENLQGIAYALGIFQKFPKLERVTVHFVAPYQGWTPEEQNEKYVHTFHRSECPQLELRIRTVIARKKAANERLKRSGGADWRDAVPKDGLCLWCARKGDCKKLHSSIIRSSEKYPDFVAPAVLDPLKLTRTDEVKLAFRWANQVEYIAKAIKGRCTTMALTENLELGDDMKIVKREERQTKDIKILIATALEHGCLQGELESLMSVPFTKVEELVKKKAPRGKGAESVRQLQEDWEQRGATEYGPPVYFLKEVKSPKDKQANNTAIDI